MKRRDNKNWHFRNLCGNFDKKWSSGSRGVKFQKADIAPGIEKSPKALVGDCFDKIDYHVQDSI